MHSRSMTNADVWDGKQDKSHKHVVLDSSAMFLNGVFIFKLASYIFWSVSDILNGNVWFIGSKTSGAITIKYKIKNT